MRERVDIPASVEASFDCAQDCAGQKGWWDPFVQNMEEKPLNGRFPQEGTKVKVVAWHGLEMTCEYLKYDRPNLAMIQMIVGPKILKSFTGTWRFMFLDHERTAVIFLYGFEMAKGWQWLEFPVSLYFRWDMKRRMHALKMKSEVAYGVNLEQCQV